MTGLFGFLPVHWTWQHSLLSVLGAVCAFTDVRNGKIYNYVTYPLIIIGLLINVRDSWLLPVLGFVIGFTPFAFAALKGMIGGGDAKMFGAVGAIGGFPYILHFLFWTFSIAVIYSLLLLIWEKRTLDNILTRILSRFKSDKGSSNVASQNDLLKRRIPMGVFSFLGILVTLRLL
jgi:Flp pilus assembly protein protease CpaA